MTPIIRTIIIAQALLIAAATPAQAGGIKKWVDENGITHYGTVIPPEYVDSAHSDYDDRGIERRRYDRAPTPEEIKKEEARQALRVEQQKLLEEQRKNDELLLNLYRNEDDLVMARNGKITQLDGQIGLEHAQIRRLKDRLSEFQAVAAAAERTGKQLTPQQKANLDSTQRSIENRYANIIAKEDEKSATIERYEADLARFRELHRGTARAANVDEVAESEFPDLVDTAVRCDDPATCGRMWETAQRYAREHATTEVDLAADRILVTAPPREIRDISITVSRLQDAKLGGERIFMDVQCVNFTEGREFCRGPQVSTIRDGFRLSLGVDRTTAGP